MTAHLSYRTHEGFEVFDHTPVYEILYKYLNPEVSLAEPHKIEAGMVPRNREIYFNLTICQRVCDQLNQPKTYQIC